MKDIDKLIHDNGVVTFTKQPDKAGTTLCIIKRPGPEAGDHEARGVGPDVNTALNRAVFDAEAQGWLWGISDNSLTPTVRVVVYEHEAEVEAFQKHCLKVGAKYLSTQAVPKLNDVGDELGKEFAVLYMHFEEIPSGTPLYE